MNLWSSILLIIKLRRPVLSVPGLRKRAGFGIAPILYMLGLVGVGAGVLFSGYSQILRSNVSITGAAKRSK